MERDFIKILNSSIDNDKQVEKIAKALTNKTRRNILKLLQHGPKSIYSLSLMLDLPMSTVSEHVSILIKSGICSVFRQMNDRGQTKIIARQYENINISLIDNVRVMEVFNYCKEIPIGSYSSFNIHQYCGMNSAESHIGERDNPNSFYEPERFNAEIIWFDYGYLNYIVPVDFRQFNSIIGITFSFEVCSEAPNYCEDWESDIFFEIDGLSVGQYKSPGDYGARHGLITPAWWGGTQYGMLKHLEVKEDGTYLDGVKISNVALKDLDLKNKQNISFTIGVKEDARNRGGINLFGAKFGDYPQHIKLSIAYKNF